VSPLHPKVKLAVNDKDWILGRQLTVSCALCGWTMTGPLGETQVAFREHRAVAHGERDERDER
jgi:hypothetical protein